MAKAHGIKRRHVSFEVLPIQSEEEVKTVLTKESLRFFGEYGMSFAQLKLSSYDPKTGKGIVTCSRDYAELIPGFLALIEHPRMISRKTSGMMNKLNKT